MDGAATENAEGRAQVSLDWALIERLQRLLPPSETTQYRLGCLCCGSARATWCGCYLRAMMEKTSKTRSTRNGGR